MDEDAEVGVIDERETESEPRSKIRDGSSNLQVENRQESEAGAGVTDECTTGSGVSISNEISSLQEEITEIGTTDKRKSETEPRLEIRDGFSSLWEESIQGEEAKDTESEETV